MLHRLLCFALMFALLPFWSGCAFGRRHRKPPRAAAVPQPMLTGTISLVNADAHFVLIDNGLLPVPTAGAKMKSYTGTVETAELVATDVRKRPFTIADVRSGTPRKGDRVFVLPTPGSEEVPAVSAAPVAQGETAAPEPPQLPMSAGAAE